MDSDGAKSREQFRVGDYLIEPRRNRVSGPEGPTTLEPRVMDVLCALADRAGQVVARAELIDQLWGVEFGGDESLTRAVSHLRKVFGDTREEARVIETIPKRGYRLIAPVSPSEAGVTAPPEGLHRRWAIAVAALALSAAAGLAFWLARPEPARMPAERTGIVLVVRPFTTDAGAQRVEGFAEELSAEIARSPLIRARAEGGAIAQPTANTMQFALQGDVRRVGANMRVSVQLVDAASRDVVWGERYERPYDPQFSARESVIGAISGETHLPLLRAAKAKLEQRAPTSLAPWEAVLLVTWVPGAEARPPGPPVEDSYWLQRHALAIDPDYAPAHALFAELAAYHALFHPPFDTPQARERARGHAERALLLAPYDAEVLYQVALYHRFSGERARAEAMLRRVLDLQPHHPLASVELAFVQGQCSAEASAAIERLDALQDEMSPANPARWVALAHQSEIHLADGDFARARQAAIDSREIIPMTWTAMTLAAAEVGLGQEGEAAGVLAQHQREWPALNLSYFADHVAPRWCLGGERAGEAQAVFRRLARAVQRP